MHQQFSKIRFATLWKFLLQYYGKIFCNFREKVLAKNTGFFAYERSSSAIRSKISSYSLQMINQVGKNIDDQLARLVNDSISIEFSELVQYALANYGDMTEWEKLQLYNEMYSNYIKNFSYFNFVSDVLLSAMIAMKYWCMGI